eukprot:TRINITY_DN6119_c0_g1_i1.p1 TRINITY_DN6119_c0_g1~~TRINITY_DN6119_c0_g1_i1.p1  ORF type:complete len:294 (-),score=60.23 TRINITY_DN6119_c0_g1_i1:1056-1937(-)
MASAPPLLLRPVGKGRAIDRQAALSMWKNGQVVGLFNLPNEDAFNACQDFCIEDSALLVAEQEAVTSLKAQVRAAIEKSVQAAKDALEAKEKLAEESKQHLLDLEQYREEKAKFEAERQSWKKERKTLQRTIENHLAEIKKMKEDHLDVEALKKSFREREAELKAERDAALSELQEQLRDERESMAILVRENRDFSQRMRTFAAENAQLRQSTVELTTTDLMNRKALLQYLEHINAHQPPLAPGVDVQGSQTQSRPGGLASMLAASTLASTHDGDTVGEFSAQQGDEDDDSWS